ncbi:MAG TPA: hypothetical protein VHQ95_19175 [Pyrinomonadaceae bacterium]|nr:hypothetical protein [Pyrinomonadaceae bacterium]
MRDRIAGERRTIQIVGGVNGLYVGVPVLLGAKGLEQVIEITLTIEERIALQKSAAAVQELVSILGI